MLAPITQVVGAVAALVIGLVSLAWVPALPLRPIVGALPGPVRGVIAVLLSQLAHPFRRSLPVA